MMWCRIKITTYRTTLSRDDVVPNTDLSIFPRVLYCGGLFLFKDTGLSLLFGAPPEIQLIMFANPFTGNLSRPPNSVYIYTHIYMCILYIYIYISNIMIIIVIIIILITKTTIIIYAARVSAGPFCA